MSESNNTEANHDVLPFVTNEITLSVTENRWKGGSGGGGWLWRVYTYRVEGKKESFFSSVFGAGRIRRIHHGYDCNWQLKLGIVYQSIAGFSYIWEGAGGVVVPRRLQGRGGLRGLLLIWTDGLSRPGRELLLRDSSRRRPILGHSLDTL